MSLKRREHASHISRAYLLFFLISAFEYLHSKGRSHCDAHQDNVLVSDDVFAHGIMLIDFGSGHRQSDSDQLTIDAGHLGFKPVRVHHRHQKPIGRAEAARDFEIYDFRALGAMLAYMREIFFADASVQQLAEYDQSFAS
jgi:hypothetical protein